MKKKVYIFLVIFMSVFLFSIGKVEGYSKDSDCSIDSTFGGLLLTGQSVTFSISIDLSGPSPNSTSQTYDISYSFSYTGNGIDLTQSSASVTGGDTQSDSDGVGGGSYTKSMSSGGSTSISVTWTCSAFYNALQGIGFFSNKKVSLSCSLKIGGGTISVGSSDTCVHFFSLGWRHIRYNCNYS